MISFKDKIMLSPIVMKTFRQDLFVIETMCQYFETKTFPP